MRIASQWRLLNAKEVEVSVVTILSAVAAKLAEGERVEIRGAEQWIMTKRKELEAALANAEAALTVAVTIAAKVGGGAAEPCRSGYGK